MDAELANINWEVILVFHKIDRTLYSLLALELLLDPVQAMNIMAFWLSLERLGFRNTISKLLSLAPTLVYELALEAIICLNYLTTTPFPSSSQVNIPLTERVIGKGLSIPLLVSNQSDFCEHLKVVKKEVCDFALRDIMEEAQARNAARLRAEMEMIISSFHGSTSLIGGDVPPRPSPPAVHPDDRTLFVTFSRGYPVAEKDVHDFFTRGFGECVESICMQQVKKCDEQSIYARVVFFSPVTIEEILLGEEKAKFTINGRHAWARKFVRKSKWALPEE